MATPTYFQTNLIKVHHFFKVNPFAAWLRILAPSLVFLAFGGLYFWVLGL